ncbi:MAG: PhoH family protein [Planctomycetota bacterium]|nr:PhoH family protein [Planctomycetota bacterium]
MTREQAAGRPKLFVLDTNVLLHDAACIRNFEENDVAIPISVLEELDKFKKGNGDLHFQAREFLRRFDELTGDVLSEQGASLGEGLGSIRVVLGSEFDRRLETSFYDDSIDHRILNTALHLQDVTPGRRIVLVSKDTNLRMKAKSLGLRAQDYTTDKVASLESLYKGKRMIEEVPQDVLDDFHEGGGIVDAERLRGLVPDPVANENFVLRNGSQSVLATYRSQDGAYHRIRKQSAYGIQPRNSEQAFAIEALTNDSIQLVTLAGTAGTGKTLLALAAGIECRRDYRQILLARPVVPLSNRDLGFLPGDIDAKLDPYMQPLYDNLSVIRNELGDSTAEAQKLQAMRESEKILITPLAYIRGRTLQRIYFIVDEAQNLTPHEVKTIITRAGAGTKIVLTGDIHQIDHPYLDSRSNGISYLIHRMRGQPLYAHVTLERGERSKLAEVASTLL